MGAKKKERGAKEGKYERLETDMERNGRRKQRDRGYEAEEERSDAHVRNH